MTFSFGFRAVVGLALPIAGMFYGCGGDETSSGSNTTTTTTTADGGDAGGGSGASGGAGATGGTGGTGGSGGQPAANGANCDARTGQAGSVDLVPVHQGLGFPMMVTHAPGDDSRLYIVERNGRIVVSVDGASPTEFLDVNTAQLDNDFTSSGEGGVLGLAFHPDYVNNGRFWVHYTANPSSAPYSNVIQEFARDASDPNVAVATPTHPPTITVAQQQSNHNGGSIEFSPSDGFLYIGIGDGGPQNDPEQDALDVTANHLGKILRLDVSPTDGSYDTPPGNVASPGLPEIYDWGLRNPYRFSFDMCTADRYIGDVGQYQWEEIDIATEADGGTNWGWSCFEGDHAGPTSGVCPVGDEVPPAHEYAHGQSNGSVTGGVVYRGHTIDWLRGYYFFGDWNSGRVWMFRWDGSTVQDHQQVANLPGGGVVGFGNDNRGEVYVAHSNGTVYRVEAQ